MKNDMNATEDFFKDVGISHIVAAALSFFNMENINSTPKHPLLTDELLSQSGMEKWAALSMCIKELLEKYVSLSLDCPNHPNFPPETSNDSVYEYAKEVLSKALFILHLMMQLRREMVTECIAFGNTCCLFFERMAVLSTR